MINAITYGFVPNDTSFDNTPLWNAFLLESDNSLYVPPGNYTFLTKPNVILKTIVLFGNSMSTAVFVRTYNAASMEPFICLQAGLGSIIEDMSFNAGTGTSNGIGLQLASQSNGTSPDFTSLRNINVSGYGGGTWQIPISFDGVYRANQSLSGLRDIKASNLFTFAATYCSISINTVHGMDIQAQCFSAGGTTNEIQFNAWSTDPCTGIQYRSPVPMGPIKLYNTNSTVFIAPSYGTVTNINSTAKFL